ncbi:MAG: FG-GAP-like repeat-containing protein [Polyangiales bacterium]
MSARATLAAGMLLAGCTFDDWVFRARDAAVDARPEAATDASIDVPTDSADDVADAAIDAVEAGCEAGFVEVSGACTIAPPRLVAPGSGSVVTSRRPTLRWLLARGTDGATVEVCGDRACERVEATIESTSSSARPTADLAPGTHWWRATGRIGGRAGTVRSATWQLVVGARSAPVESVVGRAPDLDGDGLVDVIAGRPDALRAPSEVRVFRGSRAGLAWPGEAIASPEGSLEDQFGDALAVGDFDGDGFVDLLVGARQSNGGNGAAWIARGGAGPRETRRVASPPGADGFGHLVAGAGDVDGDGYADALVANLGSNSESAAVYAFRGGAGGLTLAATLRDPLYAVYALSIAGVGDLNADGFADVAIGAPRGAGGGRVDVFYGRALGFPATPSATLSSPATDASFGVAVAAAGDVNGDGYADMIVGASESAGGGGAWVFLGSAAGVTASSRVALAPGAESHQAGVSVAGVGDLDGDGYADVAVGAPSGASQHGRVYVYRGAAASPLSAGPVVLSQSPPDLPSASATVRFGRALSMAGDVDGDGYADLAVGVPSPSNPPQQRVEVFRGSATGLSVPAAWVIASPSRGDFGDALAQ